MVDVLLTERAEVELNQAYDWWAENRSSEQAERWYAGFVQAMLALGNDPMRCPQAPENDFFRMDIRQLNYGLDSRPTHRAVYTIRPDSVVILRIRHLAQAPLSSTDL